MIVVANPLSNGAKLFQPVVAFDFDENPNTRLKNTYIAYNSNFHLDFKSRALGSTLETSDQRRSGDWW